jgi:hypothetical protein
MNVDATELKAVEATATDEISEILALSLSDLDLVGGGASFGIGL